MDLLPHIFKVNSCLLRLVRNSDTASQVHKLKGYSNLLGDSHNQVEQELGSLYKVVWIKLVGCHHGVEAVIDKDLASALCAVETGADTFYILTDVPKVYLHFRTPREQALDVMTVAEAKQYLSEGQFTEGSMAPKVRAGIRFIENGGRECIITEAGELDNPACGTRIVP